MSNNKINLILLLAILPEIALKAWVRNAELDVLQCGILVPTLHVKPITFFTLVSAAFFFTVIFQTKGFRFIKGLVLIGCISNTFERLFFNSVADYLLIPFELLHDGFLSAIVNLSDIYIFTSLILLYERIKQLLKE
jgi:lipoprotein signal peptidase